jgi:ribosomal protein L30/L7E
VAALPRIPQFSQREALKLLRLRKRRR